MNLAPLSGSSSTHSRLSPSSSKQWKSCTRSVSYVEENADKILPLKYKEVLKLTPYLREIPAVEVFPYEWRAVDVCEQISEGLLSLSDLSKEQIDDIWKTSGSIAAREGTRAHEHASAILQGVATVEDIPEEFRQPVGDYVRRCQEAAAGGGEVFIESKVPLFYSENPEDTGTCDFAVIRQDRIIVRDLKYGAGVREVAPENTQLATYALSFAEENHALYDFDPNMIVEMHIDQPRHHEAEDVSVWIITLADLRTFCRDLHHTAIQIRVGKVLKFAPSEDACRWCDAKSFCTAKREASTVSCNLPEIDGATLLAALPDLTKEEAKAEPMERLITRVAKLDADYAIDGSPLLSDDMMLALKGARKAIESWLDDVCELVEARALSGDTFGGRIKLVTGREGNRAWRNEAEAEAFLKNQGLKQEERYTFKVISPTAAEAILKPKFATTKRTETRFKEIVSRSPGKTVAAFVEDERPGVPSLLEMLPTNDEEI